LNSHCRKIPGSPRQDLAEARGATETREFKVYRWNPDDGKNPSVDTYHVDTTIAARWCWTR